MKPIISSMHFVYVIQSQKDNTYYIGYTQDLVARIAAHKPFIRHALPRRVIYV